MSDNVTNPVARSGSNMVNMDAIWRTQVRFEHIASKAWQGNWGFLKADVDNESEKTSTAPTTPWPVTSSREVGWRLGAQDSETIIKMEHACHVSKQPDITQEVKTNR